MNPLPDDPPPVESLFADRRPALRTETLEDLDKIVEDSSEKNRNFFIAYLGLLIYVRAKHRGSATLTEIDRTLCTLPACADLKGDIEGLDCGPFAGTKTRTP
jgi:hypothetical protein